MVNQVCFQVIGNDTCVSIAAEHGQLELNVMMPVIAYNVLLSMRILTNAAASLSDRTVRGIEANEEQCAYWVERSAALATALAPQIGYARAAEISKQSVKENVLIRDLVKRERVLPDEQVDEVLDMRKMTEIGVPGGGHGGVSAGCSDCSYRLPLSDLARISILIPCGLRRGPSMASYAPYIWQSGPSWGQ